MVWEKVLCLAVSCSLFATPTPYSVDLGTDDSVSTGGSGSGMSGDFRYVLNQILNNQAQGIDDSPYAITFSVPQVTLSALPPMINLFSADTIVIGNEDTTTVINGGDTARPFFIRQGSVTLQNLTIESGLAQGGNGNEPNGGGGMGAGGALFVDEATVTLNNVSFSLNTAGAGLGGISSGGGGPGGGGGLGGNGGTHQGGGGGYSGNGGSYLGGGGAMGHGGSNAVTTFSAAGGGGGAIIGADGGAGATTTDGNGSPGTSVAGYVFGGGGGGGNNSGTGGDGGGTNPGTPSGIIGGGGGYNGTGVTGGVGGGGGGGSSASGGGNVGGGSGGTTGGQPNTNPGGYGAGNGSNCTATAGFGGGGSYSSSGGFGGGGGSDGEGGFGAGGGHGHPGGVGGCASGGCPAGGDAACFGGAIFVNTGTLIFQGNISTTLNYVTPNGGNGASAGNDLFAVSGATLIFAPGEGNTISFSKDIADDSEASVPSGYTWEPGSGDGAAVTMQGPGTLLLNGNNTYVGLTTVSGGSLYVNGQILGGVTVEEGTLLGGTGTISGESTIDGTLSPGSSIGTLTFDTSNGDVTLSSSAVTNIEIDPTESSSILITGSGLIFLDGTVNITADPGSYPASQEYTILEGIYAGEFDPTVTGGPPGYRFALSYGSNFVYLSMILSQLTTSGLTGNALKVATYLNNFANPSTLILFEGLEGEALYNALSSVSPSRNAFGTFATQQTAFSLSSLLSAHSDALRTMRSAPSKSYLTAELIADASDRPAKKLGAKIKRPKSRCSAWVSGFGQYAHQRAHSQNPAFHYLSEAALGGCDYLGANRNSVGGALGYAHTRIIENHNAGSGSIDYYFSSLYANIFAGNFYFSPAVWGFFNENHNTRHIFFTGFSKSAKAHIFAWQLLPHLEVGYDFRFTWGDIVPFSSADWAISWQRGYSEHGAAPFNARSSGNRNSMVQGEAGLKLSERWDSTWGALYLREKVSYIFQKPFGTGTVTTAFTGIPTSFTVTAVNQVLNLADLGLDFAVAVGKEKPTTIDLGFEGEFGSEYIASQLMLTVRKDF